MAGEELMGLTAQELMSKREEVEAEIREHSSVLEEVGEYVFHHFALEFAWRHGVRSSHE